MTDWFSSLANQAKQLADSVTETIVTQANAAKDEFEQEQKKIKQEVEKSRVKSSDEVLLPWESDDESMAILSQSLMEYILKLSLSDRNFTTTSKELKDFQISFKDYVPVVMKMLNIDSNLSRMHAKLSPKMNEEVFWINYYQRCMFLRAINGFEGAVLKEKYLHIPMDTVIFTPSFEADYNTRKDLIRPQVEEKLVSSVATISASQSKEKDEEEAKLVAEVEEELNNGDIDLSDLEDLGVDDDFETIGNEEIDDDLEAQIARELGEFND